MKSNKLCLILGLLLLSIVGWQLSLVFREAGVVSDFYPTRAAAQTDGLFERGWLPTILPASTTDIIVRNDLDLNRSTGSFSFDQKDLANFLAQLTETPQPGIYRYQDWRFTLDSSGDKMTYEMKLAAP